MKKIERIINYYFLNKSVKEMELIKIKNKVAKKDPLTKREILFLDLYQSTMKESDLKDFLYLSKNSTFSKIKDILEKGVKIICNLHDKNGKFGIEVIDIENNFEDETCIIRMKHEESHKLHDKFLYNLIYNTKKNEYSLEEQDEYFEKIESKND
jgi:O-phosphoseryl-tRNA(Cys) synthetase